MLTYISSHPTAAVEIATPSARNDVVIWWLVLLICPGNERDMVGVGNAARPTGQMRIAPIS